MSEPGSSATVAPRQAEAPLPPMRLGAWNLYFLAKFALLYKDLIGFHPLENLAFALALLAPIRSTRLRIVRNVLAVPVALALLYYDSWLPPFGRVISQAALVSSFSPVYLLELAGRFVSLPAVVALVVVVAGYFILARWVRVGVFVMLALVVLLLRPAAEPVVQALPVAADAGGTTKAPGAEAVDLDQALKRFFAEESKRAVSFGTLAATAPSFDVIFLHVCSLSWDDLAVMGLDGHPLWKRFDITLTRFNSASTYSGPAAIRIQRAACGQQSHDALYAPVPSNCYLMDSLKKAGFETGMVLNHDGHFDDFLKFVQAQGGMQVTPMPLAGLAVSQYSFDGSPIYDDRAVLARWLENRERQPARSMAVYYNSVSLHDGNRLSGDKAGQDSMSTFKVRLNRLLDDLDGFIASLEQSGRRAVVVMIPEHGAAVRGDRMQIAGLREIPSPAITLVPVGLKVIGPDVSRQGESARVNEPTSYLAVSALVARMIEKSPFGAAGYQPVDYVANLPTTPYVAQNENVVVMGLGGRHYLKQGKDAWIEYRLGSQ